MNWTVAARLQSHSRICALVLAGGVVLHLARSLLLADPASKPVEIKNPTAAMAIGRCENAIEEADASKKKAEIVAIKDVLAALDKAKLAATKAGDLDDALAIQAKLKEYQVANPVRHAVRAASKNLRLRDPA